MIYILIGEDTKNKNEYIRGLTVGRENFLLPSNDLDLSVLMNHASNNSLFGENPVVIVENILKDENLNFSKDQWAYLKDSKTVFIFKEDKLLASEQKKYKSYGEIKIFENKKILSTNKFNVFSITDSFANRDKVNTWILYGEAIERGIEPEAIAGILFWKIKKMILEGSRVFDQKELLNQSSQIISIYHKAHRGETDFTIGLEQFILSSLSSS